MTIQHSGPSPDTRVATDHTRALHADALAAFAADDTQDFDDARRGLVAEAPARILDADGRVAVDRDEFAFLDGEAPATVHPSLWRQARLNRIAGLFEVVPGVYQVRGIDVSVMTIVEGDTGIVVIDPLTTVATAAAGLGLYREHRGDRPVRAVVYTHSHTDHYGGARGVVDERDVIARRVEVIAPVGFLQEAASENVYAGTAMQRRAMFQFGMGLEAGPTGFVDAGLGQALPRSGSSLIPPTRTIESTGERAVVDGVELEFVIATGTEAPAEFLLWLPQHRVLDTAEEVTHSLHNLYAPRGAQMRDARAWWRAIDEVLHRYGDRAEAMIAQHHWPVWGGDRIRRVLEDQRDLYKFLHDRTLHLANRGVTVDEIADRVVPPTALAAPWWNRGYYGTVRHNARAVFNRYLGWYDSNPITWNPHEPVERARRQVEYMGGADALLTRAERDFAAGDYRWVADVVGHLVLSEPGNTTARELAASALEQLGYQQESSIWRNEYLRGAHELRVGPPVEGARSLGSGDVIESMTTEMLFDYLGIRLDSDAAAAISGVVGWTVRLPDRTVEHVRTEVRHGLLLYRIVDSPVEAPVRVRVSRSRLAALVSGRLPWQQGATVDDFAVTGDARVLDRLFAALVEFRGDFPIMERPLRSA